MRVDARGIAFKEEWGLCEEKHVPRDSSRLLDYLSWAECSKLALEKASTRRWSDPRNEHLARDHLGLWKRICMLMNPGTLSWEGSKQILHNHQDMNRPKSPSKSTTELWVNKLLQRLIVSTKWIVMSLNITWFITERRISPSGALFLGK